MLKQVVGYFDKIRVLISISDSEPLKRICDRFKLSEVYEKEFNSQADRFNFLLQYTQIGDWFYMAHDDELPSIPLLENIHQIVSECEIDGFDSIAPAWLYEVDYHPEMPMRDFITSRLGYIDKRVAEKYGINISDYTFMRRIFKVKPDTKFSGFVHESLGPYSNEATKLVAYPLIHRKISGGFISSTVRQSTYYIKNGTSIFTYPIIVGLEQTENDKLILDILNDEKLDDINIIEKRFRAGEISSLFKQWMLENCRHESPYVFAWYIMYFLKYHPEQGGELDKKLLNLWIDHNMSGYDTLPVINSTLHPYLKDYLLAKGIRELKRGVTVE